MDPHIVEYAFGTGIGEPTVWHSPADTEFAGFPAVRLDFDGDGLLDDMMWDSDGDGIADHSILDADLWDGSEWDGSESPRLFTDPTGLGTWNHEVPPLVPSAAPEQHTNPQSVPRTGDVPERATPLPDAGCAPVAADDGVHCVMHRVATEQRLRPPV
ncbi:hypothetical protein DW322_05010 [Rhodococcus rhodnii]|uniref:Uncharacterized protein n=2 Tax=Rhodococcus rhodnii TaxID=38312 RepID=R7WHE2_9NOCA|nr:hypothetical protein [Rhodococcus rhodnii]EOM74533.1 hypothetical protein Rrhod_4122 [Rhodococcus rhodnii LMG 5362]TXG89694.1 hypothetical protein DW322_05010 [Rhodococcus rhodnii]